MRRFAKSLFVACATAVTLAIGNLCQAGEQDAVNPADIVRNYFVPLPYPVQVAAACGVDLRGDAEKAIEATPAKQQIKGDVVREKKANGTFVVYALAEYKYTPHT